MKYIKLMSWIRRNYGKVNRSNNGGFECEIAGRIVVFAPVHNGGNPLRQTKSDEPETVKIDFDWKQQPTQTGRSLGSGHVTHAKDLQISTLEFERQMQSVMQQAKALGLRVIASPAEEKRAGLYQHWMGQQGFNPVVGGRSHIYENFNFKAWFEGVD